MADSLDAHKRYLEQKDSVDFGLALLRAHFERLLLGRPSLLLSSLLQINLDTINE